MLRLHREPTGAVFHFADGSFIRCIRWSGRKARIAMSIEQTSVSPRAHDANRPFERVVRPIHHGIFLEHEDGSRRCIWEGTRKILHVLGRRFPHTHHYFLPEPDVEEILGLW